MSRRHAIGRLGALALGTAGLLGPGRPSAVRADDRPIPCRWLRDGDANHDDPKRHQQRHCDPKLDKRKRSA